MRRTSHSVMCSRLLLVLALALAELRPTRSQFGGGRGADSPGGAGPQLGKLSDGGPQLGKLTDDGAQLGKLPGAGAADDSAGQARLDMIRKQLERGSRAGGGGAKAGADSGAQLGKLSDDGGQLGKLPGGGAGGFDPSKLAPGGGGGGESAGFNPSKLDSSENDAGTASARGKTESKARPTRGQERGSGKSGSGASNANKGQSSTRPWERDTGGSSKTGTAGKRGAGARAGGRARDSLDDLDALAKETSSKQPSPGKAATKTSEQKSGGEKGRGGWFDRASSWFAGGGSGSDHTGTNKSDGAGRSERSGVKGSKTKQTRAGGGDAAKEVHNAADAAQKKRMMEGESASRDANKAGGMGKQEEIKPAPLDESVLEEFYRKRASEAQGSPGGAAGPGARTGRDMSEGDDGNAAMSSLTPPTQGDRVAGSAGMSRTDGAGGQMEGSGAGGRGSRARGGGRGGSGRPAPPPAAPDTLEVPGGRERRRSGRPAPPPTDEMMLGVNGGGGGMEATGGRRRRGRPAPPPLEPEALGSYPAHYEGKRETPPGGWAQLEGPPEPNVTMRHVVGAVLGRTLEALWARMMAKVVVAYRKWMVQLSRFSQTTDVILHSGARTDSADESFDDLYFSGYARDDAAKDKYWKEKGRAEAKLYEQQIQFLMQQMDALKAELEMEKGKNAVHIRSQAQTQQIIANVTLDRGRLLEELSSCEAVKEERDALNSTIFLKDADLEAQRKELHMCAAERGNVEDALVEKAECEDLYAKEMLATYACRRDVYNLTAALAACRGTSEPSRVLHRGVEEAGGGSCQPCAGVNGSVTEALQVRRERDACQVSLKEATVKLALYQLKEKLPQTKSGGGEDEGDEDGALAAAAHGGDDAVCCSQQCNADC